MKTPTKKSPAQIRHEKKRQAWEQKHCGTGRTTHQMKNAPPDAFYIWCNTMLHYPKDLARHLGRTDLRIESPSWVHDRAIQGHNRPIIIDHATELTRPQYDLLAYHHKRIKYTPVTIARENWNAGNCQGQ